jgi:hypothetical protein
MVFDTAWPNSTSPDNSTLPPPNSTFVWVIPPDAGRSLQPDIIACAVVTFLIAAAFVALRFYTRGWVNRVLGASDWCILPALVGGSCRLLRDSGLTLCSFARPVSQRVRSSVRTNGLTKEAMELTLS